MSMVLTVAYVVGFFALVVAPMVWLAYHGVDSDVHGVGGADAVEE